jgi:hypothetical protein
LEVGIVLYALLITAVTNLVVTVYSEFGIITGTEGVEA